MAAHVVSVAPRGDLDAVISAIDQFAYHTAFLINVGDEKGAILDAALRATHPVRLLELGTYCGYSALRMVRAMPADAHLWSIERHRANAVIAAQIWRHAGVTDRVDCLVGTLDDDGHTLRRLINEHGFAPAALDFVFIDHAKDRYVPDLLQILEQGWLHAGSVVVADNIESPGAPEYLDYMRKHEGLDWQTTQHRTHLEYHQRVPDVILESTYLGERPDTADRLDNVGKQQ